MSHILEEELHAYLDQALSRSRCVVIESHLASCGFCRSQRDGSPPCATRPRSCSAPSPPRGAFRYRWRSWSAGGWRANRAGSGPAARSGQPAWSGRWAWATDSGPSDRRPARPNWQWHRSPAVAVESRAADAPNPNLQPVVPAAMRPAPRTGTRPVTNAAAPAPAELAIAPDGSAPPSAETSTTALPTDPDPGLQGFWRTVPWDKVQDVAGQAPARVEGVPVEEVQVQASRQGGSPMMVVAQRLSSGEVIQTIEGPAADVSQLLSRRGDGGLDSAGRPAEAMQRGDRMLVVTGELPSDSLRAMVRRVNAARRVR